MTAACETLPDIARCHDIERLVREFDRAAAMDDLLSGMSAPGAAPVEPVWRRVGGS
jgi:hypothetical protein